MSHVYDEVGQCTKALDDVLASLLQQRQEAAQSMNALNVDPIGQASSRLTRTVIENAIVVRAWILDLQHVELARERFVFVLNLEQQHCPTSNIPPPSQGILNEPSLATMSS